MVKKLNQISDIPPGEYHLNPKSNSNFLEKLTVEQRSRGGLPIIKEGIGKAFPS